jgi:hypothetical protein
MAINVEADKSFTMNAHIWERLKMWGGRFSRRLKFELYHF